MELRSFQITKVIHEYFRINSYTSNYNPYILVWYKASKKLCMLCKFWPCLFKYSLLVERWGPSEEGSKGHRLHRLLQTWCIMERVDLLWIKTSCSHSSTYAHKHTETSTKKCCFVCMSSAVHTRIQVLLSIYNPQCR